MSVNGDSEGFQDSSNVPLCTVDDVLNQIPYAKFQYRLLLMCGLSFMADAMEVSLLSFISDCAGDDWNLSPEQKATIVSVVFGGELFGSLFWGPVADYIGRRKAFLVVSVIISVAGFLSAFSPSYGWLVAFRLIVGFGVGGLTVPFDLLAEFIPSENRGTNLLYIEYFWTIGSLFVTGTAWATLSWSSWRLLTAITAIPVCISSIICILYLPESPRWLLLEGRVKEAEDVLKEAAALNKQTLPPFRLAPVAEGTEISEDGSAIPKSHHEASFYDLVKEAPARRKSLPLWHVWLSFGFTYYGLILFIGKLYSTTGDDGESCSFKYSDVFINASAEILGVFFASTFIERIGRCGLQVISYGVAGIMIPFLVTGAPEGLVIVLGMIGRMAIMSASVSDSLHSQMRAHFHFSP
jgi:MFS family permease